MFRFFILLFLLGSFLDAKVTKFIQQSNAEQLVIQLETTVKTEADLRPTSFLIGLPNKHLPTVNIQYLDIAPIPFTSEDNFESGFEWINQQPLQGLETATLSISPRANSTQYYKTILITISYSHQLNQFRQATNTETTFLKNRVVNWNKAKDWFKIKQQSRRKVTSTPSGQWVKFYLTEDAVTSITGESILEATGMGSIESDQISLFMSHEFGRSRTQLTNQTMTDNLVEVTILIEGDEDGMLDPNDRIIFYGRGPSGFDVENETIEWHQNIYFTQNTCWLLISDDPTHSGKRIITPTSPSNVDLVLDYGIETVHFESDLINLEASGTEWVSSAILGGGSRAFLTQIVNPKSGVDFNLTARFRGHSLSETSAPQHNMSIHLGSTSGEQIGTTSSWSGTASRTIYATETDLNLSNGSNVIYVKNSSTHSNSSPFIDYLTFDYGRGLAFGEPFSFSLPVLNQKVRFTFDNNQSSTEYLWDISTLDSVLNIPLNSSGYADVEIGDKNQHYTLFDLNDIGSIDVLENAGTQSFESIRRADISVEYIIVGPSEFEEDVAELISLRSPAIYAPLETIYKEFSAGNQDPMAIRSFIQWTQERWISPVPYCMLILGDGGYDYRNITGESSIVVPTIQVHGSRSYATDDRLVALYGNIPAIATGRFPAKNSTEVGYFVEKVLSYEQEPEFGPWRQKVTLVADDAARPEPSHGSISTGKSHTLNSEEISEIIPSQIQTDKIYMMEYPEVADASAYGVIKPDATEALFNQLESGTAILSYIGHGSPYQLAQEKLLHLDRGDMNQINTGTKLPLWIVGTCSFGHFDDPLTESFSEELIRDRMNAAGMVISTSRPITVSGNERYTKDLFETIFAGDSVADVPTGVILQSVKDGTSEGQYFHLFGDPGMRIPLPKGNATIQSITPDTLETLSTGSFQGETSGFESGNGYVTLIDAERPITREYTISSETYSLSYNLPGATLFRGQFSVQDRSFSGAIRVPQDISYSSNPSSLRIYIHNDETDAVAIFEGIQLQGGEGTMDTFGPTISFETQSGKILEFGDHISKNEILVIRISDPMGINLTNEIGHEIEIQYPETEQSETITDYFFYDQNSIQTGTIDFGKIQSQEIHFILKAWDNANNPSEKELKLFTTESQTLKIFNAYNFPNPFSHFTQFTFEITKPSEIQLDIFTLSGRRIRSLSTSMVSHGFHTIDWDGLNQYGEQISNGVYLYRLQAKSDDSKQTYIGRCSKLN